MFQIPVVAVTGTCGKTTTKEMIKHILLKSFQVQSTYLSRNSIYFNLTYLLGINRTTEAAVFETGVAAPGNLAYSCRYFAPTIGMITNIGVDHLEGCGTLDNYIKAKAEMLAGLGNRGILILNSDCEQTRRIDLSGFQGKILYFGQNEQADYRVGNISFGDNGIHFELCYGHIRYPFHVPGYGEHEAYNAAAATAACHMMGIGIGECSEQLHSFQPVKSHLELYKGIHGSTFIDVSWSSNPTSIRKALDVLNRVSLGKRTMVILGSISMLGEAEKGIYEDIAKMLAETGINELVTLGKAEMIGNSAIMLGMDADHVHTGLGIEQCKELISGWAAPDTVILIKASMKEKISELIQFTKQ